MFIASYAVSSGFRLFVTLLVIALVVPQTPKKNRVVKWFRSSKFFKRIATYNTYREAKQILQIITWFCVFFYLFLSFVAAL